MADLVDNTNVLVRWPHVYLWGAYRVASSPELQYNAKMFMVRQRGHEGAFSSEVFDDRAKWSLHFEIAAGVPIAADMQCTTVLSGMFLFSLPRREPPLSIFQDALDHSCFCSGFWLCLWNAMCSKNTICIFSWLTTVIEMPKSCPVALALSATIDVCCAKGNPIIPEWIVPEGHTQIACDHSKLLHSTGHLRSLLASY